jgi:hypothetical protein
LPLTTDFTNLAGSVAAEFAVAGFTFDLASGPPGIHTHAHAAVKLAREVPVTSYVTVMEVLDLKSAGVTVGSRGVPLPKANCAAKKRQTDAMIFMAARIQSSYNNQ